jgi:hypothetical protein
MNRRLPSDSGEWTVAEARARYFAANGFSDDGYDRRWVKLMAGPVPLYFPNTAQRVRSVRLHDIHHVLTGYETTWTGEGEIAAWEIASSCGDHWAAWVLNLSALAIGLFIDPSAMYRAFVRGRHSANLYVGEYDSALLSLTVAAMRARLHLDHPTPPPSVRDRLAFFGWGATGVLTLAALPLLIAVALSSLLR